MREILAGLSLGALLGAVPAALGAPAGLQPDIVLDQYGPLSGSGEVMRRMLTPLAAAELQNELARTGKRLAEQSIELAAERFVVYVPAAAPPHGYALLAFVPPWQDARLPEGWGSVLDRYGMIFVSAARSGNEENALGRRAPLALLAAYNLMQRYPVDAARVYVGGFSGGARIAERLALAYPDLFHGALLNAGSDPLGAPDAPIPPEELLRRFQESTRLVYLTGERDVVNIGTDSVSVGSMRKWCVAGTQVLTSRDTFHTAAAPADLARALQALESPVSADPGRLARCREALERDVSADLQAVQALIAAGRRAEAQKRLLEVDRRFGGAAAPRTLELQKALGGN
jgi:hypothetical protein